MGGPHNKDCTILGSILESPYFGKLLYRRCTKSDTSYRHLPKSKPASAAIRSSQLEIPTVFFGVMTIVYEETLSISHVLRVDMGSLRQQFLVVYTSSLLSPQRSS